MMRDEEGDDCPSASGDAPDPFDRDILPGYANAEFFATPGEDVTQPVTNQRLRSLVQQKVLDDQDNPRRRSGHGGRLYPIGKFKAWQRLAALLTPDGFHLRLVPGYAGPRYFKAKYGVASAVLRLLVQDGIVKDQDNPACGGDKLYHVEDVGLWFDRRVPVDAYPAGDVYADPQSGKAFLWVKKLDREPYRSKYHATRQSIYRWERDAAGCGTLDGRHPTVLRLRLKQDLAGGGRGWRDYVEVGFLDDLAGAGFKGTTGVEEENWIIHGAVTRMGMDPKLAIAYSDNNDDRRGGPGKPHPVLGRPIRTKSVEGVRGRRRVYGVRYWKPDIKKILEAPPPDPDRWVDPRTCRKAYRLDNLTLWYYQTHATPELDHQKLDSEFFAMAPEFHRRTMVQFWSKEQVARLSKFLRSLSYDDRDRLWAQHRATAGEAVAAGNADPALAKIRSEVVGARSDAAALDGRVKAAATARSRATGAPAESDFVRRIVAADRLGMKGYEITRAVQADPGLAENGEDGSRVSLSKLRQYLESKRAAETRDCR